MISFYNKSTKKISFFQDRYDPVFQARVDSCPVITVSDLARLRSDLKCAQLRYSNEKKINAIANTLQIMNDFKVRLYKYLIQSFSNTDISSSIKFLQKSFSREECRTGGKLVR